MSLTFGFYNSINGDRVYDAIQVSQIFDGIITDGVYATFMKGMVVKASSNASEVIVQPGRCWFNHTWTYIDADYPVEAPTPEVILDRVDALVIDINQENAFRENKLTWVQGIPASINPERPTLINTVTHHQYPLAYIYRKAGTTMIYAADITNAVGTSECPFVTGVLKGLDIDAWLAQWDDEFHTWENTTKTQFEGWMVNQQAVYNTWFNAIKDQMEGDLDEFEDWFETIQGIIDSEAATHLQQEIDDLNDRLPAGSFIEITTTESQLFNRNVTVSDGIHSKTVQFDAYGNATVESFPYVGLLTITSTDGVRTATESLSTPYYARYNVTLAFWSATVNLVGDSSATAGIVVSVYDSESAIPLTSITLDSQGRGSYTATYPDTYKFRYSYGGQTMEVSLAVTQETTYTVEIHAGFNYQAWLTAGRVSGTFASLDAILANEAAIRQLMLVHDSVDYLADQMVNADVTKIFNNNLAAKWINNSDYALDKFYAVADIKTVMDTADKYGYGEWTLMPQVPTMTSNTAPYGEAFATAPQSRNAAYRAFDGDSSTYYMSSTYSQNDGAYLGYEFTSPKRIERTEIYSYVQNGADQQTVVVEGYDGSTWKELSEVVEIQYTAANQVVRTTINTTKNDDLYSRIRIRRITNTNGTRLIVTSLQFYAWAPKGNVPVMTANNAPYGEVSATSVQSGSAAYYPFMDELDEHFWMASGANTGSGDALTYKFVNPVKCKKLKIKLRTNEAPAYDVTTKVQASNDGTNWSDVSESFTLSVATVSALTEVPINADNYYLYYKIVKVSSSVSLKFGMTIAQFYGRELKVSVPTMTSNTAPFGEAIKTTNTLQDPYKAFDTDTSSYVTANSNQTGFGVGYEFGYPIKLVRAVVTMHCTYNKTFNNFIIQGSNDNSVWVDISSKFTMSGSNYSIFNIDINANALPYKMYRVYNGEDVINVTGYYDMGVATLQFYGLDYSEKEFEVGTTKKWLYDHGVELETLDASRGIVTKNADSITLKVTSSSAASIGKNIDLTPYSLMRAKVGGFTSVYNYLVVTSSISSSTADASAQITSANSPYNPSLDVSAFNQTKAAFAQAQQIADATMELTELWLE